ncbi:MAG: hypothetical protein PHV03_11785 [Desulfitobacteriaceae bacterium]|nr:hypothetical protein [Desulfitobacteriaceae bacterium]MDD4079184.1 hypothetical protein [Eubacteriales bacterium]MDD4403088.1 hypothetical protein [Desulfitobacteriaceae bacterium]
MKTFAIFTLKAVSFNSIDAINHFAKRLFSNFDCHLSDCSYLLTQGKKTVKKHYKFAETNIEKVQRINILDFISAVYSSPSSQGNELYPYILLSFLSVGKTAFNNYKISYVFDSETLGNEQFSVIAEKLCQTVEDSTNFGVMLIDQMDNKKQPELFAGGFPGCKLNSYERDIAASISLNLRTEDYLLPFLFKFNLINLKELDLKKISAILNQPYAKVVNEQLQLDFSEMLPEQFVDYQRSHEWSRCMKLFTDLGYLKFRKGISGPV